MKLIAFTGNIGVGKDCCASILAEQGWVVVALADKIKQLAAKIFLFNEETLFGPSHKRNAVDIRGKNPAYWQSTFFRAGEYSQTLRSLFDYAPEPLPDVAEAFRDILTLLASEPEKFSARRVLQLIGTEWGRTIWPEVWIRALHNTITKIAVGYGYSRVNGLYPLNEPMIPIGVTTSDCRFPNEVTAINSWGGQAYWVDASKRCPRDMSIEANRHASEADFATFDAPLSGIVDNNGTHEDLKRQVLKLV